jgi:hypothetical protein
LKYIPDKEEDGGDEKEAWASTSFYTKAKADIT